MIKSHVISILEKSEFPLSVPEILKKVKANKTTIYRDINEFQKNGLINKVEFGDRKKRYEMANKKHHHHLICKLCGKIEDVEIDENIFLNVIKKSSKFKIEGHSLEFFGICNLCTKK